MLFYINMIGTVSAAIIMFKMKESECMYDQNENDARGTSVEIK